MGDRLHSLITDFTSGELSPRWQARVSGGTVATPLGTSAPLADIYRSGCKELTNMLPLPQGGAALRLGTRFGAYTDNNFKDVINEGTNYRLSTFRIDGALDLTLLWRPLELRIFDPDGMVLLQTLVTPYEDDVLPLLVFTQSRLEMVVLSRTHRPRILRLDGFIFELVDSVDRLVPPQYAFSAAIGGGKNPVTIARSYKLTYVPSGLSDSTSFSYSVSNPRAGFGRDPNRFISTWNKNQDASFAEGFIAGLRNAEATINNTVSVIVTGVGEVAIQYNYRGSVGDGTGILELDGADLELEDLLITDGEVPQAETEPLWSGPFYVLHNSTYYKNVISHRSDANNEPGIGANTATYWQDSGATAPTGDNDIDPAWVVNKAYFPRDRGWPTIGTFHEQRLVLNGPATVPHILAAGKISQLDYLDFALGVNAADGILLGVANESGLTIMWFLSQRKLFIGTSQGVYIQTVIPFTPLSLSLERHSMLRAARQQPLPVNGEILYFQGNRRQVRKVQYVNDIDMWEGRDMTIFAEHLFRENQPMRDWTYEDEVDSIVWTARDDGLLLSMTYDANYNVAAWAKHNVGAPVRSVETVHNGSRQLLVMIVKRTLWDAATGQMRVRPTLEVLEATSKNMFSVDPDFVTGEVPGRHLDGALWTPHVDAYEQVTGDGTNTITIPRFARQLVRVVEGGVVLSTVIASPSGVIQLDTDMQVGTTVFVGYPYPGRLVPNRIQFTSRDGTSQSQKIRWTKPVLRLFASTMPLLNGQRPRERKQTDNYDTESSLFSGDVSVVNFGTDTDLEIVVDQSLPCHITGIFGLLTVEEG